MYSRKFTGSLAFQPKDANTVFQEFSIEAVYVAGMDIPY
jgi:hypothetical protein